MRARTASTGRETPAGNRGERGDERRLAVIDLGSNTFRLVVFRYRTGASFQLVDEVREPVRLSAGSEAGRIADDALERARHATRLYADFCRAAGIAEVLVLATSAARDAVNHEEVLRALSADGTLPVRIVSEEDEARYGYLGAVNSTTLAHGFVLDVGGGSLQVSRVRDRRLVAHASRPLGAVRMTERFLTGDQTSRKDMDRLRGHVAAQLDELDFFSRRGGRLVGLGGTIRTLAAMSQRRDDYHLRTVHGYVVSRESIRALIDEMAAMPAAHRPRIRGLKRDRADVTLGGALVVEAAMDRAGADRLEVCGQGLREGAFYEHFLAPADPPLVPDVRRQSVLNLAANLGYDRPTPSTSPACPSGCTARWPTPAYTARAPRSTSSCGPRRCCTTWACWWTITTTSATPTTWCSTRDSPASGTASWPSWRCWCAAIARHFRTRASSPRSCGRAMPRCSIVWRRACGWPSSWSAAGRAG